RKLQGFEKEDDADDENVLSRSVSWGDTRASSAHNAPSSSYRIVSSTDCILHLLSYGSSIVNIFPPLLAPPASGSNTSCLSLSLQYRTLNLLRKCCEYEEAVKAAMEGIGLVELLGEFIQREIVRS